MQKFGSHQLDPPVGSTAGLLQLDVAVLIAQSSASEEYVEAQARKINRE